MVQDCIDRSYLLCDLEYRKPKGNMCGSADWWQIGHAIAKYANILQYAIVILQVQNQHITHTLSLWMVVRN